MITKTCRRCSQTLAISNFYRHAQMADGYLNFCRECTKKRVAKRFSLKRDEILAYDRVRHRTDWHRERVRAYSKTEEGKGARLRASAYYRARNRDKISARGKLRRAMLKGLITKTLCSCGNPSVEAHHPDYSKPLEVTWLCIPCHRKLHWK